MNKQKMLIVSLLFSLSVLHGMFFKHNKDKNTHERDNKIEVQNLDDVKKMKEAQLAYRSKHHGFKDESSAVKIEQVEKK